MNPSAKQGGEYHEAGLRQVLNYVRLTMIESAGIRTQDLRIKSALLYRLSYTPFGAVRTNRPLTDKSYFTRCGSGKQERCREPRRALP